MGADSSDTAVLAVTRAVAEREGVDPIELPPLFDAVDCQALNALFDPTGNGADSPSGRIAFTYSGYEVVVRSDGRVALDPADWAALEPSDGRIDHEHAD